MPKGEKLPPFVEKKVRLWYRMTNQSKTGFVDKSDFAFMAESFVNEYNLNSEQAEEIRSWLVNGWDALIQYGRTAIPGQDNLISAENTPLLLLVGEKISKGDKITEDMYVNAFSEVMSVNPQLFPVCFSKMVSAFFNVFDTDRDGLMSEADMIRGLRCFGMNQPEAVQKVFAELDKNKSGKIDKDTYVGAWLEYMTGTDEEAPIAKYFSPENLTA